MVLGRSPRVFHHFLLSIIPINSLVYLVFGSTSRRNLVRAKISQNTPGGIFALPNCTRGGRGWGRGCAESYELASMFNDMPMKDNAAL